MNTERAIRLSQTTPEELKSLRAFVCFRLEPRSGQPKPAKVPYNPLTAEPAKANDPTTWTTFENCIEAVRRGTYPGIGLEIIPPYIFVDLDHCRDVETGKIEDWAHDIVRYLNSYTEFSVSGTGIHVLCKGDLPPTGRRLGPVEMYDSGRYAVMTGDCFPGTPAAIEHRAAEILQLHDALFPLEEQTQRAVPATGVPSPLSDSDIIERASHAANGVKFQQLWRGDWQGLFPSQSEADQSLCRILAFWAGNDEGRIDAMFRRSGLYRKKWERADYRDDTITKAVENTPEPFRLSSKERVELRFQGVRRG